MLDTASGDYSRPHRKALNALKDSNPEEYRKKMLKFILTQGEKDSEQRKEDINKMLDSLTSFTRVFKQRTQMLLARPMYAKWKKDNEKLS